MTTKRISLFLLLPIAMLGALYGCSKKVSHNDSASQQSSDSKSSHSSASIATSPSASAPAASLSKADLSFPLDDYQKLETDAPHWMAMYYGTANIKPVPYHKFADQMVGYAYETNPFKKQDELKQIVPEVRQMVATASKNRYYFFYVIVSVGNYNMATKTFPIQAFSNGSYYSSSSNSGISSNYGLTFSNGSNFKSYYVSNQTTAESLENTISNEDPLQAKVYFYAQGTEYSMVNLPKYTTIGQITKVVFYPPNDTATPLFEIDHVH